MAADCVDFGTLDDPKSPQSCVIGPVTRVRALGGDVSGMSLRSCGHAERPVAGWLAGSSGSAVEGVAAGMSERVSVLGWDELR